MTDNKCSVVGDFVIVNGAAVNAREVVAFASGSSYRWNDLSQWAVECSLLIGCPMTIWLRSEPKGADPRPAFFPEFAAALTEARSGSAGEDKA